MPVLHATLSEDEHAKYPLSDLVNMFARTEPATRSQRGTEACSVSDPTQQLQATLPTSTCVQSFHAKLGCRRDCTARCNTATQQLIFPPNVGGYLPCHALLCTGMSSS